MFLFVCLFVCCCYLFCYCCRLLWSSLECRSYCCYSPCRLVTLQILSAQEFLKLRKKQKEALSLATKRQEDRKKRLQTEQDRAKIRQQQTAAKIDEQTALFNKEKSLLISEVIVWAILYYALNMVLRQIISFSFPSSMGTPDTYS